MSIHKRNFIVTLLVMVTVFLPICVFSVKLTDKADNSEKGHLVKNGVTMVYLRNVCEKGGVAIEWDKYTKSIVLKKGVVKIKLLTGSNEIIIDDKIMTLDAKVIINNGKTIVPINFPWYILNVSVKVPDSKKPLSVKKGPIVFFGDSITQGFPLNKHFIGANLLNKGVSGNTTADALKRIKKVTDSKPDKVFIMLGTNDLWTNTDMYTTLENYEEIITAIRSACPYADIVIQSVMPFGSKAMDRNAFATNFAVDNLNAELQNLAKSYDLSYIDVGKLYKDSEGNMRPEYSGDGVHICSSSYSLWASYIRKLVR